MAKNKEAVKNTCGKSLFIVRKLVRNCRGRRFSTPLLKCIIFAIDKLLFIAQILGDIVGQGLAPAVKVCAIFAERASPFPTFKPFIYAIF